MANVSIDIHGVKELENLLKQLPQKKARKAMDAALRAGANELKKAAQAKAPVDTGLLRASIIVRKSKASDSSAAYQVGTFRSKGKKNAFYAHMVEFGTSKMAARPFLRPAFIENQEAILKRIIERLAKSITTEAMKFGGMKPKGRR